MKTELFDIENLRIENQQLLEELEAAYKNMEIIFQQTMLEKQIAYQELQQKYQMLDDLYRELSNRENLLIHLEKLSSIGQFIAEIIHELSSPLTGITTTLDLIQLLNPPQNLQPQLNKIRREVDRMCSYLSRFKSMVYKEHESFQTFDVNENLKDCFETLDIIKPRNVHLALHLAEEPLRISGDPYQIHQIYLNLAKNAMDAIGSKEGHITFVTRKVDKGWILTSGEWSGHYCQEEKFWKKILERNEWFALVEVKDDGDGIRVDFLKDIFEAFFTTKGRGKGTGLGLSISRDIVKRHGGNLGVKSTPGKGTTFQLLIPLVQN
ncbi:MAG: sensor histidine kinase [Calditrichaeota bacterium]|nr:MAG: sensor histidine kinase [Calditrichota bacterium]